MEKAFVNLKEYFTTAPIPTYYSPEYQCIIETDTSDFALGAIIFRKGSDHKLHPIAYHMYNISHAEINYEIYNKELLEVIDSFKIWQKYLKGTPLLGLVHTNHQNLEYFTTTIVLNRRRAHWAQELAGIDLKICYRPRHQNGKLDVLS
jgi:hypothetical protein